MMRHIESGELFALAAPLRLDEVLRAAFSSAIEAPTRAHFDLPGDENAKLLIMPAWHAQRSFGVKIATVMPANPGRGLATVRGVYLLMDITTGAAVALLDGAALTAVRTAAVSALGANLLARADAAEFLILGTGALAPHVVRAMAACRPLRRVRIWGRDTSKAAKVIEDLGDLDLSIEIVADLEAAVRNADIISTATASATPIISADWVSAGTHVDLIGSFAPDMAEIDPQIFLRGSLAVDTDRAYAESGDLIEPLRRGWIIPNEVPTLSDLLAAPPSRRTDLDQITIFKAVGTGEADLAIAEAIAGS